MAVSHQIKFYLLAIRGLFLITTAAIILEPNQPQSRIVGRGSVSDQDEAFIAERGTAAVCKTYVTQAKDTCNSIAQAHGITLVELYVYNFGSWRFDCTNMPQGSTICVGPGSPPMPTARYDAKCGPLVPGTIRPSNWSALASLNPCPSNNCCTSFGICEAFGDQRCKDDTCMSNCLSTAKDATNLTTTTTSKLQTTTLAKTTSTTTKEKTTPTTTSQGPTWTLVAYTGTVCDGDYYLLTGHKDQDSKCINLPGDYKASFDDQTGVYCKYFTKGGLSSSSCASGPVGTFVSWSLTGGICTASDKSCNESGGQAISIDPKTGCQADVMKKHVEMKWRSIRCMVH